MIENGPEAFDDVRTMNRKYYVRWLLGGLFLLLSAGAGFVANEQHGITIGWLTFILFSIAGVVLYRLALLFDENRIADRTIGKWHKRIIAAAENTLGRRLTNTERHLITSRGGCIALEMIHDSIRTGTKEEIISYLNSESAQASNTDKAL